MSAHTDESPESIEARVPEDNPLRPQALVYLALAGGAAVIGVIGYVVHGSNNALPCLAAAAVAAVTGGRGLMLYLQPFAWPSGAPAGIRGVRKNVGRLIRDLTDDDSHLGTYSLPTGFAELVARAVAPRFTYQTPATRALVRLVGWGIVKTAVCVLAGVLLVAAGYALAGLILIAGAAAIAGFRLFVLYRTVPDRVPGTPVFAGSEERLTEAGNPIEFVKSVVRITGSCRDGDHTRMTSAGPSKLKTDTLGEFDAEVTFESRPLRTDTNPEHAKAAGWLEYGAVGCGLFGLLVFVMAKPVPDLMPTKAAGLAVSGMGVWMLAAAFRLRNTFRFTSDLIGVWATGTYQHQKGGLNGAVSAEVSLVKSSMTVTVLGTRVVTECTLRSDARGRDADRTENVRAMRAASAALTSPRYVVRTAVDDVFRAKVAAVAEAIRSHRDVYRDVVGLNLDSAEAVRVNQTNVLREQQADLFKHQLLVQAQAQGQILAKALEGITAEQALQMLTQGGSVPLGSVTAAPTAPPPALPAARIQPDKPAAPPVPSGVEKVLVDALKAFYGPGQSADAKALAKRMVEQIQAANGIPAARVKELAKQVQTELGTASRE